MTDSLEDLAAERATALTQLGEITDRLRVEAVRAVGAGETRTSVCARAGITRPTLNQWIKSRSVRNG